MTDELRPCVSSLAELAQRCFGDLLGRDAEVAVKILVRAAGAEARHADEQAVRADDRVPTLPHRGLDADIDPGITDHGAALRRRPRGEQFEARHRYDAPRDALLREQLCALDRERAPGAGGEDRHVGTAVRSGNLVGALRAYVLRVHAVAQ